MFKKLLYIFSFISLPFAIAQVDINNSKIESDSVKLIITLSSFHNAKEQDARALSAILAEHIRKAYDLKKKFYVETPSSLLDIEKSAGNTFDYIIMTTDEYIKLQKKLPLEPYMTNLTNNHIGYKLLLIVNKSSNITNLAQLQDKSINILSPGNQQSGELWLDKLLKDNKLPSRNKFFKAIVKDSKPSNVLLPVIFNKADACIITESALHLLSELNPAILNKINTLHSSEYILLGLACLNKFKNNGDTYKILKDIIPSLHENEYGKQILQLFGADRLVPFKEEYLKEYYQLFK